MNKRATAAILAVFTVIALAGPSSADDAAPLPADEVVEVVCPPDTPANVCLVVPHPEQCSELNNWCQPPDAATLAERNRELRHQVEVLEYEAAQLKAQIQFKNTRLEVKRARIRLLKERLEEARR